jgi:AcrR family transcriptional regulator
MTPRSREGLTGARRLHGEGSASSRNGVRPKPIVQRPRILAAMARITYENGLRAATVAQVLKHSRVGRQRFYELYDGLDDCFLDVFKEAVALAEERATTAFQAPETWPDRVRAGLIALLEFFDEEPELARVCVVHALAASRPVLVRRRAILSNLATVIDEGNRVRRSGTPLPPLTAEGIVGAVFSLVHARLLATDRGRLVTLASPLMAIIVLPYQGAAAAQRQLARPVPSSERLAVRPPRKTRYPLEGLEIRMTYRTMCVLSVVAASPGASNRQIADGAEIKDQGQISKLLGRLEGLGLIRNGGPGASEGGTNSWTLTARGSALGHAFGTSGTRSYSGGG